jgi:hypothetical protein
MKEGKKVRRVIWEECGAYIHIVSETIVAVCDGKFFPCVFKDSEDILATDWEEVGRMKKKILTLTIDKQWFDMVVSGKKKEEYRVIKDFWMSRLLLIKDEKFKDFDKYDKLHIGKTFEMLIDINTIKEKLNNGTMKFVPFTHVLFKNGYYDDSPKVVKEIESITIGKPKKEMCPDKWLDHEFFIIKFK